jgi:bifunctional UDP-N-acetylglucosamine pyrophosphorylase/glucosamine-1-phosphate N-acetyltransferase
LAEQALILAAGKGTRMHPLTARLPKPLLPAGGAPFLEHQLRALAEVGVKRVAVLVGYRMRDVHEALGGGDRFELELEFLVQEEQLGTGHAVAQAAGKLEGDFFCLNGDTLVTTGTLRALAAAEGEHAMAVAQVADCSSYGLVEARDGKLANIIEKSAEGPGGINAGIYRFAPSIFAALDALERSPRGEYELTTALEAVAPGVAVVDVEGDWLDLGRPWDLLTANALLLARMDPSIEGTVEEGAVLEGAVHVAAGAIVKAGSRIEGPAWIGPGATVGPNAIIRGATMLGAGAKVGTASEVKNSILMDGAKAPHHNYVGDSILGRDCNLGSGTKVANLRYDGANVYAIIRGERVDSGLRKLGVILGDDVKTGVNASLNVGTILGEGTIVGPGRVVSGSWAAGSRIL